ncbi:hypothetical protein PO909_001996 [Leuciscus waleckii]
MADSTITVEDIEGELFKIERIKDALVRKESELRYMMDDIQLCKEITRLKKELQKLVSIPASFIVPSFMSASFQHMLVTYFTIGLLFPRRCTNEAHTTFYLLLKPHIASAYKAEVVPTDKEKSNEDRQREEELLQQIQKLVETRDFLVDDMEFERLREREEDKEMADFLQTKFPNRCRMKSQTKDKRMTSRAQQTSSPYVTKTGVTLLKECCGFTCSIM